MSIFSLHKFFLLFAFAVSVLMTPGVKAQYVGYETTNEFKYFLFGYVPTINSNNFIDDTVNSYNSTYGEDYKGVASKVETSFNALISDHFSVGATVNLAFGFDSVNEDSKMSYIVSTYCISMHYLFSDEMNNGFFLRADVGYADLRVTLNDEKRVVPGTAGALNVGYALSLGDFTLKSIMGMLSYQNITSNAGTISFPSAHIGFSF